MAIISCPGRTTYRESSSGWIFAAVSAAPARLKGHCSHNKQDDEKPSNVVSFHWLAQMRACESAAGLDAS